MSRLYQGCILPVDGAEIVVQSCDDQSAHIGVFETCWRGRNAYHHVSLLDFTREFKLPYPFDLRPAAYDRILTENRCDETAYRQLMQAYAAQGRRSEALRQFQHCKQILHEELGISPTPETTHVYHSILASTI